jgi:hypothetical protein
VQGTEPRLDETPADEQSTNGPLLSSIVLNWNRSDLLRITLESYVATVTVPYELFIIDNASSDDSRSVIEDFGARHPGVTRLLTTKNVGGSAFNYAIERSRGAYVHLSENDIEYLPGWWETAADLFSAFPDLGQLSLLGPVPTDAEVWEVHPATLVSSNGRFLYRTEHNVGTTSILRREVFDAGVQVRGVVHPDDASIVFPADRALSVEVREAGYMVAWAPRYLVRNRGHEALELEARPDYYRQTYQSKAWVGEAGLEERQQAWKASPKPRRQSHLFSAAPLMADMSSPNSTCPEPQLWTMLDDGTAELETLELLYALARLAKPRLTVQLGAWRGFGAAALGLAAQRNGVGEVIAVEDDPDSVEVTMELLTTQGVADRVRVQGAPRGGVELPPDTDFLVISTLSVPPGQLEALIGLLPEGALVVIEHWQRHQHELHAAVAALVEQRELTSLDIKSPRGVLVAQRSAPAR